MMSSRKIDTMVNADFLEIGKFTKIASQWWDTKGLFKPLHDINPLRLKWIEDNVYQACGSGLVDKTVLDVGCGGGILTEGLVTRGAKKVTGIDLGLDNLTAAKLHAKQQGMEDKITYECISVEDLASQQPGSFDVVTCMEMVEHVPSPERVIAACFSLLKPGGVAVFSTINRNVKSYLFAIIGAEYLLGMLERGTHDYAKLVTPAELDKMAVGAGFARFNIIGLHYNPITRRYWLAQNVDVNYMMAFTRPEQ